MHAVETQNISKSFGKLQAVKDVTFNVRQGELFGLLGPNGAGKTTIIRLLLDIFKPDQGQVSILGGSMSEAKKNRIGYMPEERGLYQDVTLERALLYLISLKDVTGKTARSRLDDYLERFDLIDYRKKKVKELSKGMQQKAQLIVTLLHQPELLIIDEPFSGLDPVNTQMVKQLLLEIHRQGVTVIMSTHQMHQVEAMCERILLIHKGITILYGDLYEIQQRFAGNTLLVRTPQPLPQLPGVLEVSRHNESYSLSLAPETQPQQILETLLSNNLLIEHFEIALPSLDDIFVRVVRDRDLPEE